MKKIIAGLTIFLMLSLILSGCVEKGVHEEDDISDNNGLPAGSVHASNVVEGSNLFAWELYLELVKENPDLNIFISPWSIEAALAMTFEGTGGATRESFLDVFHFPEDNTTRQEGFQAIIDQLNQDNKPYNLSTANRIFPSKHSEFKQEFIDILEKYYRSSMEPLDYIADAEACRKIINDWVYNQTNGKIKNIIPKGVLDPSVVLVLANAIYFKSAWKYEFDPDETSERTWTMPDGKGKTVPMMHMHSEETKFNYYEDDTTQALELPYKDEDLSMVVLLPKDDDISNLENEMDADYMDDIISGLVKSEVYMHIPKFKIECKYELLPTLEEMGMANCDFSGMGPPGIAITNILHKSFVEVNEEGTEAAAATVVVMKNGSSGMDEPKYKVFDADHNFIYLIKDNANDNILFLGKLTDPEET